MPIDTAKKATINMRVTVAEKDAWVLAARRDERSLSAWIRHVASKAARAAETLRRERGE